MINNKDIKAAMLSDDDLDNVVGGISSDWMSNLSAVTDIPKNILENAWKGKNGRDGLLNFLEKELDHAIFSNIEKMIP